MVNISLPSLEDMTLPLNQFCSRLQMQIFALAYEYALVIVYAVEYVL